MIQDKVRSKLDAVKWNAYLSETEYTERRITYNSKYLGVMIKDLPTNYIKWGILNLGGSAWADFFSRELQRRDRSFK
jgi:hypothetical protein